MSDVAFAPAPVQNDRTGFATTGLVLGIVGLVMAFIPIIGVIAFVLCPLAVIFGVLGRQSSKSGQATAGAVCGVVGLCVSIAWALLFTAAVGTASTTFSHQVDCLNHANTAAQINACYAVK